MAPEVSADDAADHTGRLIRRAGHVHQSAARYCSAVQHGPVRILTLGPEAVHRGINQIRVASVQIIVAETQLLQSRAAVVGKKHIRAIQQAVEGAPAQLRTEIDTHRAFAAVDRHELRADGALGGFVTLAPCIAARIAQWRLDLDDLGAHVAQIQTGGRALHSQGHLHYSEAR